VKRLSEVWPEREQRMIQWLGPNEAVAKITEPDLKRLVAAFAKRASVAASKSTP
jgi:hypothetical protein